MLTFGTKLYHIKVDCKLIHNPSLVGSQHDGFIDNVGMFFTEPLVSK